MTGLTLAAAVAVHSEKLRHAAVQGRSFPEFSAETMSVRTYVTPLDGVFPKYSNHEQGQ